MATPRAAATILVAVLVLSVGDLKLCSAQNYSILMVFPENGGAVVGVPATFICLVEAMNEPVSIDWYIEDQTLSSPFVIEGLGADTRTSGISNSTSNLTIVGFMEPQPTSLNIACGSASFPGTFFANFTLLNISVPTASPTISLSTLPLDVPVPTASPTISLSPLSLVPTASPTISLSTLPPDVPTLIGFFKNVTVMEGDTAEVCVNITLGNNVASEVITAAISISPTSTATEGVDYNSTAIRLPLSFMAPNFMAVCLSVPTIVTLPVGKDDEMIIVQLETSQEGVEVDPLLHTATILITCRNGDIRLVGGVDQFQGRVEVCSSGVFGTVCDDEWGTSDATVVCRQLGFPGAPEPYSDAYFGQGSDPILLDDVGCTGNELRLINCSNRGLLQHNCVHSEDAGVDCSGRPQPAPPVFSFENRGPQYLREGNSGTVCVVVSGMILTTYNVSISAQIPRKRQATSEASPDDFSTDPPLVNDAVVVVFTPGGDSTICISVITVNDSFQEPDRERISFFLNVSPGASTNNMFTSVIILDNDRNCTGNSSLCVNTNDGTVSCTPAVDVCDGVAHCPDLSDEASCPDICPPDQLTCYSESKCLPQAYGCDSYPDCLTEVHIMDESIGCEGCTETQVRLVGGVTGSEGIVQVCVGNTYMPVVFESLSAVEASVLCRELRVGDVGFATNALDQFSFQLSVTSLFPKLVEIVCSSSTVPLSECSVSIPEGRPTSSQAGLTCLSVSDRCSDGELRISPDSPSRRMGRVEICYQGVWGAIYSRQWNNRHAAVACRQLGYQAIGAVPIIGAVYDTSLFPFHYGEPSCNGNEPNLLTCSTSTEGPATYTLGRVQLTGVPRNEQLFHVAGVSCDEYLRDGCNDRDVRLTYRRRSGADGQFEICNGSMWSTTCSNYFTPPDAMVACNQFLNVSELEISPSLSSNPNIPSDTTLQYTAPLGCSGSEPNIANCTSPQATPTPPPCTAINQPTVRCSSSPFLTLSPRFMGSIYDVEVGRNLPIQCLVESTTRPQPSTVRFGRAIQELKRGAPSANFSLQLLFRPNERVAKSEEGEYVCEASTGSRQTTERFTIRVLDPMSEGISQDVVTYGYFSFSFVDLQRLQAVLGDKNVLFEVSALETNISTLVHTVIQAKTPGVQYVNCYSISARAVDVERGLLRLECRILQYDEQRTLTANQIAERVVPVLPLVNPMIGNIEVFVPPTIGFATNESRIREADTVDVCLVVSNGMVTSPISITISIGSPEGVFPPINPGGFPGGPPGDGGFPDETLPGLNTAGPAVVGIDFTTNPVSSPEVNKILLTLSPGDQRVCFEVASDNNSRLDATVRETTFTFTANTTVTNSTTPSHQLYIIDDDVNCTEQISTMSRLCVDVQSLSVFCVEPALVCDYLVINCPDKSDELNCPSPIEGLVNTTVKEGNYVVTITEVSRFANVSANGTLLQTPTFLTDISTVFGNVANFLNSSNITINATIVSEMVSTINSLLTWSPNNLVVTSTSSLVQSFEMVAGLFAQQDNLTVNFTDVSFVAELAPTSIFKVVGSSVDFQDQVGLPASISLPASLFNSVPEDRLFVGVFFTLYQLSGLFPITNQTSTDNTTTRVRAVGSSIVGATVGPGITFINIDPPVQIKLGLQNPKNISRGSESCVSWDFNSESWVTEGCLTRRVGDNVECNCNHLTNFAVLVDICSRAEDCVTDPIFEKALEGITLIGVVFSCVGLVLTIITLLAFKKLRERDNSKFHIQLSIAILCLLIVFAAGIDKVQVYGGCIVVSILIHYFSLASVMWMGAEALLMFQKLVIVFMRITKTYIIILSFVCWLVPLIPVLIPMIVDLADGTTPETDLIINRIVDNETELITGGFCFHKHIGVLLGAFLVPIFVIVLFNLVIFIWVIVILIKHTRGQLKRSEQGLKPKTALRLVISISGITFLFGLSWLFAALTFSIAGNTVVRDIFQALFVIFASFQGFFIFLFFCVFNREARESWKELLSCGKYRSEFLHPSQYKPSSGPNTNKKVRTATTGASSTLGGTTYKSDTLDKSNFDSEAPSLSDKQDLSKVDQGRYHELHTGDQTTATVETEPTSQVAETRLDIDKDEGKKQKATGDNWSGAEPLNKARVKRYSTKKSRKHHIEEVEIDFMSDESDSESTP